MGVIFTKFAGGTGPSVEVLDALDSDRTDAALSAKQGKALKEMIDAGGGAQSIPIVDTLAGNEADKGPSVRSVKEVLGKKADLVDGKVPPEQLPSCGTGPSVEVLDALDSARTDAALSAKQGRVLNQALEVVTQNVNGLQGAMAEKLNKGDILNTLDSARTDAALSAKQGKVLKAMVDAVPQVEVIDDLTTGDAGKALSAAQGKVLNQNINMLKDAPKILKYSITGFDANNEPTGFSFGDNENYAIERDPNGKLLRITSGDKTWTAQYDGQGRFTGLD